jgi:hypothetical protein
MWWCTPVIPELGRLRQEDLKFQASLGYKERPCLKKKKKKKMADGVVQVVEHLPRSPEFKPQCRQKKKNKI